MKPSFFRPVTGEFSDIDPAVSQSLISIQAQDGGRSRGMLYTPSGASTRTVVVIAHPTADLLQHWMTPYWTAEHIAVFTHSTRYVNSYTACLHELLVLDVAAVIDYLRDVAAFENVVLVGK